MRHRRVTIDFCVNIIFSYYTRYRCIIIENIRQPWRGMYKNQCVFGKK